MSYVDTSSLQKDACLKTKDALVGLWIRYNSQRAKNIKVLNSSKSKYRACCSSIDVKDRGQRQFQGKEGVCQAHVFAKEVSNAMGEGSHWFIYSFNGQHSCKDSESVRKRNYQHSQIESTSIPLRGFVPNKRTQGGAAKQVIDIASKDGMAIGRGQAHSIVNTLRVDSVPVHIGQYWLLKSYFAILEDKDPGGTFKLEMETKKKGWNDWNPAPQFKRCYVAFSFTKHQWMVGSVRIIVTDGTFTKTGIFTHTILLAVTYDGNNELVLLAFAFCPKENTDNWV
jgi:hypothetical protein